MARITVEDCLDNLENRFELVLVASKRARQLAKGSQAHLEWENDKPTVMALREISENLVDASVLSEADVPVIEEELESEEATATTMSSEAESEVGALAAQAEQGTAATGDKADGEIDVAAALAAALAADLGASMGMGATDSSTTDTAAGDDTTES